MWIMIHFFAPVFAALIYADLFVMSKAQTVFTIEATLNDNTEFSVELSASIFTEFYTCLCDEQTKSCTITLGNDGRITKVESCSGTLSQETVQYRCKISQNIVCEKYVYRENDCSQQNIANIKFCGVVTLEWTGAQQVEAKSHSDNITLAPCSIGCNYQSLIRATYPVSPLRPVQTTHASTSGISQPSSSTTRQRETPGTIAKNDDDNNDDMAIIIGAVVGTAVVVIAVVTIIVIIWRRKQIATSSSAPKNINSNHSDTDIIPYGETSLTNDEPNLQPPLPDLTSKNTYYNTIDITRDDPSEAHSQAVNKNTVTYMNTLNGEETG